MQKHTLTRGVVVMIAVVTWVVLVASPALAQRARVPQTGQTTCWRIADGPMDCTDTGQDGDIQAGVVWPTPRFTNRGDGTVRDNLTGLMWLRNADCFSSRTWPQALTDANTLASGRCGLTDRSVAGDWRLPNVKELLSLIDYGEFDPALPAGHPFLSVQSEEASIYWTSTTRISDASAGVANPFAVRLQEGTTWLFGLPPAVYRVWPLRGRD